MKNRVFVPAAAMLLMLACPVVQADEFSSLEERMTGREFRDSGLHKLTEEELAALNRWIELRSLADGEVPAWAGTGSNSDGPSIAAGAAAADNRGLEGGPSEDIRSRLVGSFSGWSGENVFELENGMVWQQAESGTFSVATMENPEVRIRSGMFGSWQLQVEGYNRRIRVERLR
ncbi:MAG TPA: hypothetical protein VKO38_07745 [Wenzhouxiangella sp.]|nr:hypothetical protein [Wenzhouxiangella sp.]